MLSATPRRSYKSAKRVTMASDSYSAMFAMSAGEAGSSDVRRLLRRVGAGVREEEACALWVKGERAPSTALETAEAAVLAIADGET